MAFVFNSALSDVSQASGWGTPYVAAIESSSVESRVSEVAAPQIEALGNAASEPVAELLSLKKKRLTPDLVQKIATYFTLQDFASFSLTSKGINALLKSEALQREICPILYRGFEKLYLEQNRNVINLDNNPTARLKLGLLEYKEPEPKSRESLKNHMRFLREAGLIAECSEDGKAVIVTIPAGWSIEKLEALSQAAVTAGNSSARINYWNPSYREVLQGNPIEKEQRVAISNTVITDSRDKSIAYQRNLLKAKGLQEEFLDPLIALTVIVLSCTSSPGGKKSSYSRVSDEPTYTRTNKKMPQGWVLCVGSSPFCVHVHDNDFGFDGNECVGVGGLRKFEES